MELQTINVGASANDGTGDPLRTAFDKINANFEVVRSVALEDPITLPTGTPVATGEDGDVAGMIRFDSTNLYVCIADYDGVTVIWKKLTLTSI